MTDTHELLDSEAAAKALGLKNKHTLEVWRCQKTYPALRWVKIGRAVRYRREDIQAFIVSRTSDENGNIQDGEVL